MSRTQYAASLTWILCEPPLGERVLEEHERILGVTFPGDFRQLITLCPGGHPVERSDFEFEHPALGFMGSCLGALVTLDPPDDVDGMLFSANALHEHHGVPRELIPFALDGGGDYMCFDFRTRPENPTVIYWSHEAPAENATAFLANSFSEFLAMLEAAESEDVD